MSFTTPEEQWRIDHPPLWERWWFYVRHPYAFFRGIVYARCVIFRTCVIENVHFRGLTGRPIEMKEALRRKLKADGFNVHRHIASGRIEQSLSYEFLQATWRWEWCAMVFPSSWIEIGDLSLAP